MYQVEVEAGRAEPMPTYVNEWLIARWMGVTLADMQAMNAGNVAKASVVMQAMNRAQETMNQQASRKGGKR